MTGRDLISATLRLIGAIAPGESVAAGEATDGLATFNRMIDSWSNESLLIPSKTREVFSLVASDPNYTIGSGGNFNTTRPQKIEAASILIGLVEYPMREISLSEYAAIKLKSVTGIPQSFYCEDNYPLSAIHLYPTPSAVNSIVLYSWKPLTTIATLDTVISLPPGYEEALVYNGAIRLAPEYGRALSQEVAMLAQESKGTIKRMNHKPEFLRVDAALVSKGRFNMLTGGSY